MIIKSLIDQAAGPQHPGSRVGRVGLGILSLRDGVLSLGPLNGSVIRDSQQNPDRQGQHGAHGRKRNLDRA